MLVNSINQMKEKLDQSYRELHSFNQELEIKVEEKTHLILEQRQQLEYSAKMTALGEMAGGIAHEINTPLAAVHLQTEIMIGMTDDDMVDLEDLKNHLHRNLDMLQRIAKIIQGLKSFSRNGAKDPLQVSPVKEIIQDTVALCHEKFRMHNIDLRFMDIPENIKVCCRPVEIGQVLLNLIHNAHDAVMNSSEKWVQVGFEQTDSTVSFTVTDSGPGIPTEIKEKIFQPFFTTKEVGKGTGLGLSISKGIIERHQGRLYIDENSRTTRFVIQLPSSAA